MNIKINFIFLFSSKMLKHRRRTKVGLESSVTKLRLRKFDLNTSEVISQYKTAHDPFR